MKAEILRYNDKIFLLKEPRKSIIFGSRLINVYLKVDGKWCKY